MKIEKLISFSDFSEKNHWVVHKYLKHSWTKGFSDTIDIKSLKLSVKCDFLGNAHELLFSHPPHVGDLMNSCTPNYHFNSAFVSAY